jgi:hypothetical protein
MRKLLLSVTILILFTSCNDRKKAPTYLETIDIQLPLPNPWEITETEAKDSFGDKTDKITRGILYRGKGTLNNNEINIFISTEVPNAIGVYAEYGSRFISLSDGVFSYKIGDKIYDSFDYRNIGGPSINPTGSVKDETKSFLYLLKQGGNIRVQVRKDGATYNFTVDADGFREAYSSALEGSWGNATYYYVVLDRNNIKVEVEFTIEYVWSYDKEERYKNNTQLEEFINNFFRTKDVYFAYDRPGGYYQREKVEENWAKPILQQVRALFSDESIEYRGYDGFRAFRTY